MYGPRPGDRVCKVNFSKLSDAEKKNTNMLLAKQDHEIIFEENGGYYVANVKFVKSPQKLGDRFSTDKKQTSKSPDASKRMDGKSKSPESNKKLTNKPSTKAVPTSAKKVAPSKATRTLTDRSKSRVKNTERSQSPNLTKSQPTDKLELIKDYQPLFPKNDLSDSNYRPIMIGKSKLD